METQKAGKNFPTISNSNMFVGFACQPVLRHYINKPARSRRSRVSCTETHVAPNRIIAVGTFEIYNISKQAQTNRILL